MNALAQTYDEARRLAIRYEQRNRELETVLDMDPNGVATFDAHRRLIHGNAAFAAMLDWLPQDLVDADLGLVERRLLRCGALVDLAALHEHGPLTLSLNRGRSVRATARLGPDGTRVLHLRDVTHETELERMKNEFLAGAAHELRTPVASILGFAELLLNRDLGDDHRDDALQTIHRQAMLLMKTVQDMIDLARIDARRGKGFRIEPVPVGALIDAVALRDEAPHRVLDGHHDAVVRVDRERGVRALAEVVANAHKFSAPGRPVEIAALREGGRVGVRVRDQGIGMTPAECARVFDRFWRAEASGHVPGAGLGMTLVREIVELQGGCVEIASEPGEGTAVTLWFPLADEAPLAGSPAQG